MTKGMSRNQSGKAPQRAAAGGAGTADLSSLSNRVDTLTTMVERALAPTPVSADLHQFARRWLIGALAAAAVVAIAMTTIAVILLTR